MSTSPTRTVEKRAPAKAVKPKKSEITRARIVDAAAHVFRQKGYALTRLEDIAKRARTRTSSIYYYFESREAIVAEVMRIANDRTLLFVTDAIAQLPADAPIKDKITAAMRGHFTIVLSGDAYTSAHIRIFDQIPPQLKREFLKVLDETVDVWRRLFREAQEKGDIRDDLDLSVVRQLLLGMMNWSMEWYRPGPLSIDDIARQASLLLFEGIAARPAANGSRDR